MDTVPHHAQKSKLNPFYVYTLAYPDGRVFYVGKGSSYAKSQHDRINDHERIAKRINPYDCNPKKSGIIREIWASGHEVVKSKVAYFENERDAYMYEWALIYMTTYSDQLTNIKTAPFPLPQEKARKPTSSEVLLPEVAVPLCIKHKGSPVRVYHQVKNVRIFVRDHPMRKSTARNLFERGWTHTWEILTDCPCGTR